MEVVASSGTTVQPDVEVDLDRGDPFEHIVCCRGTWDVALCGADTTYSPVVLIVDQLCPMCVAEARSKYDALGVRDLPADLLICFESGKPCPTGDEADQLMQRVLDRPEKLGPS